jgi:hypothetical protein
MTIATLSTPSSLQAAGTFVPWWLAEAFRREPLFAGAALVLAVAMLPTLLALGIDARTFQGENIWIKPLKFELSLGLYLATLAWFAGWLPRGMTDTVWYKVYAAIVVFCIIAEMLWVGGAAALGTASHFNTQTPGLYGLMGILAVTLTTASLVYGIAIWRDGTSNLDPIFRASVISGLILTFFSTVVVAGYMASTPGHTAGAAGDLRIPHFFATHAMHVLPAFGFIASLLLPRLVGVIAVILASGAYVGVIAVTFIQARRGLSIWYGSI